MGRSCFPAIGALVTKWRGEPVEQLLLRVTGTPTTNAPTDTERRRFQEGGPVEEPPSG